MPLYEYECEKNGHRFELIRKFSDPPLTRCIHCKSKVRKLISTAGIAFKGSGWYVTDYGGRSAGSTNGKSSPQSGGADTPAKTDAKESKSGKSESKSGSKD